MGIGILLFGAFFVCKSVLAKGETESVKLEVNDLLWEQDCTDSYVFPFTCEAGEYEILVTYTPTAVSDMDIVASIKIDGELPSQEFDSIEFLRSWIKESDNFFDGDGNEYASYLVQSEKEKNAYVRDRNGLYKENLTVELTEGQHELSMEYVSGSMILTGIELVPRKQIPTYENYLDEHPAKEYKGKAYTIQAELVESRSARDIPCFYNNDPAMIPYEFGVSRINAFGGNYWYEGNAEATWVLEVPEDGYYKLSIRMIQNNNDGLVSHRQILIDGEVPFQEMLACPFYYGSSYRTEAIGGETPFLFYLEKGQHRLTMRIVSGEYEEIILGLRELSASLGNTIREIQTITGAVPDVNFNYEIDKKMPWLLESLNGYADNLSELADQIVDVCQMDSAICATMYSNAENLQKLAENPRNIPKNIDDLSIIQGDVNDGVSALQSQPLGLDWISLQAPEEELYEPKVSLVDRLNVGLQDFLNSFKKEESKSNEKTEEETVIDLWIGRGMAWGSELERMISEEFEPNYGIKVNVNVLPTGSTTVVSGASPLLLSVVAGDEPDIALGCDSKAPIEMAIRGQLADLSQFEDFDEVAERFAPTAINMLNYEGGCYGVPETMEVPIMVYRTDVLDQNQIEIPQTWQMLWRETLPQLTRIGGNFYIGSSSANMYATFLQQNGGSVYDDEGNCALDTSEALVAFEDWTKCFVQYQMPQAASFYNEMREGTLPIGICSLQDYMELVTYAGELTGKLAVAPIPGIMQEDGTVTRKGAGDITSAVVFENSEQKEACWTFLKWWTSEDVQKRYATGIETRVGTTGRWFSANLEAFYKLPWSNKEVEVMKTWMPDYSNIPNVLGGYYTSRAITNAWTRTVMSGVSARDSLEQCYEEIDRQINRKKQEY